MASLYNPRPRGVKFNLFSPSFCRAVKSRAHQPILLLCSRLPALAFLHPWQQAWQFTTYLLGAGLDPQVFAGAPAGAGVVHLRQCSTSEGGKGGGWMGGLGGGGGQVGLVRRHI